MTDEQTEDEPVQVEDAVEIEEEEETVAEAPAEADAAVAESDAPAEVEAGAEADPGAGDEAQATVDPAVQEFIGQDTTVVHEEPEGDGVVPTEFRTPPGIPSGLDPGTPKDRATD